MWKYVSIWKIHIQWWNYRKRDILMWFTHCCMMYAAKAQAPDTWKFREILDPNAPPKRFTSTITLLVTQIKCKKYKFKNSLKITWTFFIVNILSLRLTRWHDQEWYNSFVTIESWLPGSIDYQVHGLWQYI